MFMLLRSEVLGCLLVITVVRVLLEALPVLPITLLRFHLWIFFKEIHQKIVV